ncbi:ADP-ribose pyrophosphatase YjhB (NUDIX family) [Saccharothrix carnea]|uniref:ADP-ribose pyrophosphatase YjhB (NUDIX family) n=1 Tax=Saccharothrix carnea TaxID=1280637 RepID=A0A2P8I4I4_SACCR|nr:ADP-ribose pyrophosphatase YjhB (NUDIX family) [Saccharothrix carnea]
MTDDVGRRRVGSDLAADVVLFAGASGVLSLLAVERAKQPFQDCLALPGGFVEAGEEPRAAAARELEEETGVRVPRAGLAEVGCYDEPGRDPRGRVVSVVYRYYVERAPRVTAASDARAARWVPLDEFLAPGADVAFDHRDIVGDAVVAWLSGGRSSTGCAGSPGAGPPPGHAGRARPVDHHGTCDHRWAPGTRPRW